LSELPPIDDKYPLVLFSPEGGIQAKIQAYLSRVTESVLVACYILTSRELAEALARTAYRKVDVKLVVNGSMDRNFLRIYKYLKEKGVDARTIIPVSGIQHSKFIVFDHKIVAHGSYNFTWDAEHRNFENMEFTDSPGIVGAYVKQFEVIYQKGSDIEPTVIKKLSKSKKE